MSLQRTLSWNALSASLHADRVAVPVGYRTAAARITGYVRFRNTPLFAAGAYNRAAIMTFAAEAARDHQAKHGGTWAEAMSVCLKATWAAAKAARNTAAH